MANDSFARRVVEGINCAIADDDAMGAADAEQFHFGLLDGANVALFILDQDSGYTPVEALERMGYSADDKPRDYWVGAFSGSLAVVRALGHNEGESNV